MVISFSFLSTGFLATSLILRKISKSSKLQEIKIDFGILDNPEFNRVLTNEIFPLYIKHEKTFDRYHIHERMHISRCVIYTMAMFNFYKKYFNVDVNNLAVLYTIAMHDAGRRGNGIDLWEKDSEILTYEFLKRKNYPSDIAFKFSKIINKQNESYTEEAIAIRSADYFDIMRPCCGHKGRDGLMIDFYCFYMIRIQEKLLEHKK